MFKRIRKNKQYKNSLQARGEEATTVRKIVFTVIAALLLILVVGTVAGYFYVSSALEPVDPDSEEQIDVEIPIGSTPSAIAGILEENGIINNARIFQIYVKLNNESQFQAGEYTFSPSMTINELIESLKTGMVMAEPVHTVTIPEGLTIDQIAGIYGEELDFSKEEFLDKVNDPIYIEQLMKQYSTILTDAILAEEIRTPLEGYLFAATYSFYEEQPGIETVIEKMLDETQSIVSSYMQEIEQSDFTVHEALTFASVVEEETGNADQRRQIAGVFYNRLEEGMPLQTDPTVLYALGEHKDQVTYEDLEVDSPYNTYQINTLPIGPISNFAESSLAAILNPEDSDYLYFLHDSEGQIHYAETYDGHEQNIADHME
ncbi:endolytic transglycosylase MltG [Lentibacillus sediminis]|uniref:endolytic transglycosylase MltG n=1 Tax=Lentibacillus sediminis TaxID=1940529 RepID=UPI001EFCE20F|nr:endolytic transglycosylase MltG [Lentibacillus sediminis]